jgi:hypothetical protein
MKQFYFNINATIYKDSYKEGRGDQVNSWQNQELIKAENLTLAIEKLFETRLYFSYKKELAQVNDCNDLINNILEYSNLVDESNFEILESEKKDWKALKYQDWKAGKINLYSCDLSIEIFELNAVDLTETYFKK